MALHTALFPKDDFPFLSISRSADVGKGVEIGNEMVHFLAGEGRKGNALAGHPLVHEGKVVPHLPGNLADTGLELRSAELIFA